MARSFDGPRSFGRGEHLTHRQRLERLEALASFMDSAVVIPGTGIRFGADALIGLVPGIGDAIAAGVSCLIIIEARRMGVPASLVARMIGNVAIDGLVGVIPLLGDIFDVAFRANLRNVRLLRKHLENASRRS